ncbi:MAG: DUF1820 family protein [Pseudomonadota bacterium]
MKTLFRIAFVNQGKVYEVYAESVNQGALFGFLEVSGLKFGERTSVVVDPSEEKIKAEFAGVSTTFIPLHSVLRIDEVDKQGVSKISQFKGDNVTPFPSPAFPPVKPD